MARLLNSLRAFIRRALGLAMADEITLKRLLDSDLVPLPTTVPVEKFETHFVKACKNGKEEFGRDVLSTSRISKVAFYKEEGGSEHEYVVVEVVAPDTADMRGETNETPDRVLGALKCERTVAANRNNPRAHKGAVLNDVSPNSSSGHAIPASDQFVVLEKLSTPSGHRLVYAYEFGCPEDRPPIARLIAAAAVLHAKYPDYILRSRQCYWFAGVLFRVLVGPPADRLYPRVEVDFSYAYERPTDAGVAGQGASQAKGARAGRFKDTFDVVTKKRVEKTVAEIQSDLEEEERTFETNLEALRAKWRAHKQELEDRKAETAALQVQLEERAAREAELEAKLKEERKAHEAKLKEERKAHEAKLKEESNAHDAAIAALQAQLEQLKAREEKP
ncbi:hypothetical protein OH77DRAFT_1429470 [Trametes cingulata]|nr:hypothetical protein OH77DRAFT_1429470 [Trametes cingulata]